METSDRDLIAEILDGSAEATATLVRRHWGRCHRLASLILDDPSAAEDVAQEAVLNALRALRRYDPERPFEPWLHRIVVNRSRDHLRRRARRMEVALAATPQEIEGPDPELPLLPGEELLAAVRDLRPQYRLAVVARYVLDYTPAEIAELLSIPPATVRTHLRRALEELRQSMERKEASDELVS